MLQKLNHKLSATAFALAMLLFLALIPIIAEAAYPVDAYTSTQDVSCRIGQTINVGSVTILGIEAIGISNVDVYNVQYANPSYVSRSIQNINWTSAVPDITALGVTFSSLNVNGTKANSYTVRHDFTGSIQYSIGGSLGVTVGEDPFADQCNAYL